MSKVAVQCIFCKKLFLKDLVRVHESNKFGWNFYCSKECKRSLLSKQEIYFCQNQKCKKKFIRSSSVIGERYYCSRSCSVSVNNTLSPKRIAVVKTCRFCGKEFTLNDVYCSRKCKNSDILTKEEIMKGIKLFFDTNGRIPFKYEYAHSFVARKLFGSWNKAIKAAGLHPNPVKFAHKHVAKDGHICDSFSEKIIDDLLFSKNILHEKNVPYGANNMTADFRINGVFIEFIGLEGHPIYDKSLKRKELLWMYKNSRVIRIYPRDLFDKDNLLTILRKPLKNLS